MKNANLRKTTLVIVLILTSFCVYSQQKEVKNDMLSLNGVEFGINGNIVSVLIRKAHYN